MIEEADICTAEPAPPNVSRETCDTRHSRGRRWTDHQVAELIRLRVTHTGDAIAELIGVTHAALRKKVSRLKIAKPYRKPKRWRTE